MPSDAALALASRNRRTGLFLALTGAVVAYAGAAGLIVGAALPWVRLVALGIDITLPGALGLGLITAAAGLLALLKTRRFPWLNSLLGIVAVVIAVQAQKELGRAVITRMLSIERRLAPINARLAEIPLPPIEPFGRGAGIGKRSDYVGVGPRVTTWAGAALALGAILQTVGEGVRRTCPHCRRVWSAQRDELVHFCPQCGGGIGDDPVCSHCATPLLASDKFCPSCGTARSRALQPVP